MSFIRTYLPVVQNLYKDPLHRNSFFLMASTALMSVVGFFFWIVASRSYTPTEIGLGSSLVAMTSLLISISTLGFPPTLIRFLPRSDNQSEKITTALFLTGTVAFIISMLFWLISKYLLIDLHTLINSPFTWAIFTVSLILGTWQQVIDSVFIAFKQTHWILLESTASSLSKLGVVFFLTSFLGFGIFLSVYFGIALGVIISFFIQIFIYKISFRASGSVSVIKEMGKYSAATYFASLIGMVPSQILPAMITAYLGAASAGHFFLALMMVNLLAVIPQASGQTLFSSGSTDPQLLKKMTIDSLKLQTILVSIGIIGFWVLGGWIISWFGKSYVNEMNNVLRILSLGVFPMMISAPLVTRLRIRRELTILNVLTILSAIIILLTSWLGARYGLIGVSYGYLIGQVLAGLIVFLQFKMSSSHKLVLL